MFEAIPDANQTFRQHHLGHDLEAGRKRHPAAGVLRRFPELRPLRRATSRRGRLEGRPGRRHHQARSDEDHHGGPGPAGPGSREARRWIWCWRTAPSTRPARKGRRETYRFQARARSSPLDPNTVFGRQRDLRGGSPKRRIADLRADAAGQAERKEARCRRTPRSIYIQQKFSIPAACLVFAIIGLALGLTSARDGKMAGFVVGFAVVFAYYAIMELGAAADARALPDDRGRPAACTSSQLPHRPPRPLVAEHHHGAVRDRRPGLARPVRAPRPAGLASRSACPGCRSAGSRSADPAGGAPRRAQAAPGPPAGPGPRRARTWSWSSACRRLRLPGPGLLDRYITVMYLRVAGLAFLGLLGLFYISTFLDKSEKIFKGDATIGLRPAASCSTRRRSSSTS